MHGKDGNERLPELLAKNESCKGIEHREESRQQDAQGKAQGRLASHFNDVSGKPHGAEDEEDSEQETNKRRPRDRFPERFGRAHRMRCVLGKPNYSKWRTARRSFARRKPRHLTRRAEPLREQSAEAIMEALWLPREPGESGARRGGLERTAG
jgi:hypothetical protein